MTDTHRVPVRLDQKCANLSCKKTATDTKELLAPCLNCYGATLYCDDECRVQDLLRHTLTCGRIARQTAQTMTAAGTRLAVKRIAQMNMSKESGLPRLLNNMLDELTAAEMAENIYLLPLPFDVGKSVNAQSKIVPCKRVEAEATLSVSLASRDAFTWYQRHREDRSGSAFLYLFTFPPDMSFVFIIAMPCEKEKEKETTSNDKFENILRPCPCHLHSPKAS